MHKVEPFIFCFQSEKGGVGKTTLAIHFAHALTWFHFPVVLIDADPQGSALDWAAARHDTCPFSVVGYPRNTLHKDIKQIMDGKSFAVIDSPPRSTDIARSAVSKADALIIPVQPSPFDLWATSDTLKLVEEVKVYNDNLKVGIAINREIGNTQISKAVDKELQKTGVKVFEHHIKQRVSFAEVIALGKTVMEIEDPHDKANAEFGSLFLEVLDWAEIAGSEVILEGDPPPDRCEIVTRDRRDLDETIEAYRKQGDKQWRLVNWIKGMMGGERDG